MVEVLQQRIALLNHLVVDRVRIRQQHQSVTLPEGQEKLFRNESTGHEDGAPDFAEVVEAHLQLENLTDLSYKRLRLDLAFLEPGHQVAGPQSLRDLGGRIRAQRRHAIVAALEVERDYHL